VVFGHRLLVTPADLVVQPSIPSVLLRGLISRRLEFFELVLGGPGSFGFRERTEPIPLELRAATIGRAEVLPLGRFIIQPCG
jgi:hypothetical protein